MSAPTPKWLNPSTEVTAPDDPATRPRVGRPFVNAVFDALLRAGCSCDQAIEVTAIMVLETGWGAKYRANNLGGVKITPAHAKANPTARWWRAPGHVRSGDAVEVYYRAFESLESFLKTWLLHFAPKPDALVVPYPGYKLAGSVFWTGPLERFIEHLIAKGYRGPVTAKAPARSIADHRSICKTCRGMVGLPGANVSAGSTGAASGRAFHRPEG